MARRAGRGRTLCRGRVRGRLTARRTGPRRARPVLPFRCGPAPAVPVSRRGSLLPGAQRDVAASGAGPGAGTVRSRAACPLPLGTPHGPLPRRTRFQWLPGAGRRYRSAGHGRPRAEPVRPTAGGPWGPWDRPGPGVHPVPLVFGEGLDEPVSLPVGSPERRSEPRTSHVPGLVAGGSGQCRPLPGAFLSGPCAALPTPVECGPTTGSPVRVGRRGGRGGSRSRIRRRTAYRPGAPFRCRPSPARTWRVCPPC